MCVVGVWVCLKDDCSFPGSEMDRSVGVGAACYVGGFMVVPVPAHAGRPWPSRSGDASFGVELRLQPDSRV